ncbi:unnamed protein product [Prorocentrum cordatum]|uniref:Cell division cycle protein 123 homolog n=1 Tax=Prorocentrum cordatum TaxID=2364126 RepID=A0ABN9S5C4_9DINO|nr:unnamed protein product [Polarella glacialis]
MQGEGMLEKDILACQFGSWYDHFRAARVTFKSEIIPLPEDFVNFLTADGIMLPSDRPDDASDSSFEEAHGAKEDDGDEGSLDVSELASYAALHARIKDAIARFDGGVLPKLNWSSPKDAQWVHGTLQCSTPQEVIMLLKASDFVSHDLCNSFDLCAPVGRRRPDEFTLVLRKWYDLHESGEFRCFVHSSRLVAVSQRQTGSCFPHLACHEETEAIGGAVRDFFEKHVLSGFPLTRFAFDVYVGPAPRRRVWLVDFSPWGPTTEPCLFDWDELSELSARVEAPGAAEIDGQQQQQTLVEASGRARFELRVVKNVSECRSGLSRYHNLPVELAQLGLGEGLDDLLAQADKVLEQKRAA